MSEFDNNLYLADLNKTIEHIIGSNNLAGCTVMITGATGEIGGFLVDVLMQINTEQSARIDVIACGRGIEKLQHRFTYWIHGSTAEMLTFVHYDMLAEISEDLLALKPDYIIHAAGNAYPSAFVNKPDETVKGNIIGIAKLMDYAAKVGCRKFLYVSSGETYSVDTNIKESLDASFSELLIDKRDEIESVSEALCESVMQRVMDNGTRSCYPLSKVAAEAMCMHKTLPVPCVVVRLCHTFGPGAKETDDRAHAQFARKAASAESIVLNSAGTQLRSYNYIVDSASGILSVLLRGVNGEAYDICSRENTVTIRELADLFAKAGGVQVVINEPDEKQKALQSPIRKQVLDSSRLEGLGWTKAYELDMATCTYVKILRG